MKLKASSETHVLSDQKLSASLDARNVLGQCHHGHGWTMAVSVLHPWPWPPGIPMSPPGSCLHLLLLGHPAFSPSRLWSERSFKYASQVMSPSRLKFSSGSQCNKMWAPHLVQQHILLLPPLPTCGPTGCHSPMILCCLMVPYLGAGCSFCLENALSSSVIPVCWADC